MIARRYRIEQLAGAGGMSSVFKAHDRERGAAVAVKLLQVGDNRRLVGRFLREASALSELAHPHIVEYIDHGMTAGGAPYLVMEWLDGVDLEHRIRQQPLTEEETIRVAIQVCGALACAHRNSSLPPGILARRWAGDGDDRAGGE